jgi:hypothetical protein
VCILVYPISFNITAISTVELCFDAGAAGAALPRGPQSFGEAGSSTTRSRGAPTLPRPKSDVLKSLDTGVYHRVLTIVQPSPSMMAGNQSGHSTLVGVPIESDQ